MKEVLRLFTPPEWDQWGWPARIFSIVAFWAIMVPVIIFARWFGPWLIETLFPGW